MTGRLALLGEVGERVVRRPVVEPDLGAAGPGLVAAPSCLQLADEARRARARARPAGRRRRRARTAACPAGPGAGETSTRSWVISSIRQQVRAEGEDVADPRLVDHLLVELADPAGLLADEEDAEQPAVGDRAAAGDREPLRARPAGERAGRRGPTRSAAAARRTRRDGIAPGEHVERRRAAPSRAGRRTARRGVPARRDPRRVHGSIATIATMCWARTSSGLRGGRIASMLPPVIRSRDHGGRQQVTAVLREHHAAADRADLVAGPADPLQPRRDRRR